MRSRWIVWAGVIALGALVLFASVAAWKRVETTRAFRDREPVAHGVTKDVAAVPVPKSSDAKKTASDAPSKPFADGARVTVTGKMLGYSHTPDDIVAMGMGRPETGELIVTLMVRSGHEAYCFFPNSKHNDTFMRAADTEERLTIRGTCELLEGGSCVLHNCELVGEK